MRNWRSTTLQSNGIGRMIRTGVRSSSNQFSLIRRRLLSTARPPPATPVVSPALKANAKSAGAGLRSAIVSTTLLVATGAFLLYAHDSRAGVHRFVFLYSCPGVVLLAKI